MWIGGRGRRHAGKFAGYRLTEDDRAGAAQQGDAGSVCRRPMAAINRRTHFGRHVERIDDVLDADRHALQQTTARFTVERPRLGERQFRVEVHPGFDDIVARGDAL